MVKKREAVRIDESFEDMLYKMSEGIIGAVRILVDILEHYKKSSESTVGEGLARILDLDDMNIRGTQIWIGFKDYCGKDLEKFIEACKNRDKGMIDFINDIGERTQNHPHMAVEGGASFDDDKRGMLPWARSTTAPTKKAHP